MRAIAKRFLVSEGAIRKLMKRLPKEGIAPRLAQDLPQSGVSMGACCPYIVPRMRAAVRGVPVNQKQAPPAPALSLEHRRAALQEVRTILERLRARRSRRKEASDLTI
jgi:hypothetical protein